MREKNLMNQRLKHDKKEHYSVLKKLIECNIQSQKKNLFNE